MRGEAVCGDDGEGARDGDRWESAAGRDMVWTCRPVWEKDQCMREAEKRCGCVVWSWLLVHKNGLPFWDGSAVARLALLAIVTCSRAGQEQATTAPQCAVGVLLVYRWQSRSQRRLLCECQGGMIFIITLFVDIRPTQDTDPRETMHHQRLCPYVCGSMPDPLVNQSLGPALHVVCCI